MFTCTCTHSINEEAHYLLYTHVIMQFHVMKMFRGGKRDIVDRLHDISKKKKNNSSTECNLQNFPEEAVWETSPSLNKIQSRNWFSSFFIYKPTDGLLPFTSMHDTCSKYAT